MPSNRQPRLQVQQRVKMASAGREQASARPSPLPWTSAATDFKQQSSSGQKQRPALKMIGGAQSAFQLGVRVSSRPRCLLSDALSQPGRTAAELAWRWDVPPCSLSRCAASDQFTAAGQATPARAGQHDRQELPVIFCPPQSRWAHRDAPNLWGRRGYRCGRYPIQRDCCEYYHHRGRGQFSSRVVWSSLDSARRSPTCPGLPERPRNH